MSSNLPKDYAKKLNEKELNYLYDTFRFQMPGYQADVFDFFCKDKNLDRWLSSAKNHEDFYSMVDELESAIGNEFGLRSK